MFDDTSLIRIIIAELVKKHHWSFEEAMDHFYSSKTCRSLSDANTGMFTFSPIEIIRIFEEEIFSDKKETHPYAQTATEANT